MTMWWETDPSTVHAADRAIREAAEMIRAGRTVAFPTETVYGLGADAGNTAAVERIFAAKGRPSDNPLIVHIGQRSQLDALVASCDEAVFRLLDQFWPGPLTIVLPAKPEAISPRVTVGLPTVAVRMPDHPVALALLRAAQCPIAAPSANRSGRPSPTRAAHVLADLDGRIDGIIDGGSTGIGLESTVVEFADGALHILRPGGITAEQLRNALPNVAVIAPQAKSPVDADETPKSPGMKYVHYAPQGQLVLVEGGNPDQVISYIREQTDLAQLRGENTGILTFAEHAHRYTADLIVACGSLSDPDSIAHQLYDALRQFDEAGATYILAESCPDAGIGTAVMNRLRKAAVERVVL